MTKLKGNLARSISNHPFIFLISLLFITVCCIGGLSIAITAGKTGPTQAITPTPVVAIVQSSTVTASSPSNTATDRITTTSLPTSIAASTETTVPQATDTSTPVPSTITVIPTEKTTGTPLVVTFIDVGQGDSILIVAPDGQTLLIDGGSAGKGALTYLIQKGIKKIDIMVATHPHEDHIGGLVEVLYALSVKKVITNGQMDTTSVYEHFLDGIKYAKAEYGEVTRGNTINLGSLAFSVLSPATISGTDLNHNSLVLRLIYGKTIFLFTGDADMDAERGILASGLPVEANILKVGHHGSCGSSSPAFLDAVKPEVAIYSAGLNNQYGHPCAGTINALNSRNIIILGTDVNGTIIVTVSGDGYAITNSAGKKLR
jgi:competence protein ComEC